MRPNSVRLRLVRSEVDELATKGSVSEVVRFSNEPEMCLVYTVAGSDVEHIAFTYQPGALTVRLPMAELRDWAANDRVGFSGQVDIGGGETLQVIVEKDFKCLTERLENEVSDAYPHPDAAKGHAG